MDTHLSTEEIKSYLGRKLTQHDFDRASDHVHSCVACYQDFLAELQKRFPIEIDLDELAGLQGWHLADDELAAYVEGRMDDLDFECASLHLQECGPCMEKASAATEYPLEYAGLKRRASRKQQPSTWNRHLPSVESISTPRLQLAAAAVLLLGLALFMWALLQPRSERSQLAGTPPPETRSPDPSPHQPAAPVQPGPGSGSDNRRNVDKPMPEQLAATANSEKHGLGPQEKEIERALIAKNLVMPIAIEMLDRTPSIAVRGNPASIQSFAIVRPFATATSNEPPTFSWTALNGATSYRVSVFDANLHLIETSKPLNETQWMMPDHLQPGIVYTWTVIALKDGQEIVAPAPPARAEFKILGKSEMSKLNRRVNRTASHAARGVLYAKAGLLDEAEKEFRTHLSRQPSDERVKRLLRIVKSWRGVESYPPPSPTTTKPDQ
jgi:hypothetical protein